MLFNAETISIFADVIAIVTFLFFLFGGILSGIQNLNYAKRSQSDCFIWINDSDIKHQFDFCHKVSLTDKEPYCEKLLVYSRERMYNFEIFTFQEYCERKFENSFAKTPIYDRAILDPNECVLLTISIPGCMPTHLIKWKTPTNMVGAITVCENGKEGNTTENIVYKHTFKSFIFYFFNR